jgi:small neutral amino acid transporter SnatA (MarC family)
VVQLSGGLLISLAAWRMLNDNPAESNQPSTEPARQENRDELKQRAFYPLTFPLTVGPGSISVSITLGASMSVTGKPMVKYMLVPMASLAAVLSLAVLVYMCYRHADKLLGYLGQTGSVVFLRLSAFILMCLGCKSCGKGGTAVCRADPEQRRPTAPLGQALRHGLLQLRIKGKKIRLQCCVLLQQVVNAIGNRVVTPDTVTGKAA